MVALFAGPGVDCELLLIRSRGFALRQDRRDEVVDGLTPAQAAVLVDSGNPVGQAVDGHAITRCHVGNLAA